MKMPELKIIATVEVRMGSTRLPGKCLMDLHGKPVLEWIIERICRSKRISGVVIATSINPADDPLEILASKLGVRCYRGSEEDVLNRVYLAAKNAAADVIVEFGGDSPFVDWELADELVDCYLDNPEWDLVTNCLELTYPLGVQAYVMPIRALAEANEFASEPNQREDVTRYLWENHARYRLMNRVAPAELHRPHYRLTLDYPEDLELTKLAYAALLPKNRAFKTKDVIDWLDAHPEIAAINRDCKQRSAPHIKV